MKIVFHILTSNGDPYLGGMEASVLRIAEQLGAFKDADTYIYSRNDIVDEPRKQKYERANITLVELKRTTEILSEPGRASGYLERGYRLDYLAVRNAIVERISGRKEHRHVLVSFYLSSNSFILQHVAAELGLPHIASARGSDLGRDLFDPARLAAIEFVLKRATWVVTTNQRQERLIRQRFERRDRLLTIYNSLPRKDIEFRAGIGASKQLVSDCGYSSKKATHLLLIAAEHLRGEGFPIELTIFGHIEQSTRAFWEEFRNVNRDQAWLHLRSYATSEEIDMAIASAHLFCSASFSEGCSNSISRAIASGIPLVTTETGLLGDLQDRGTLPSRVWLCQPGSLASLVDALRNALQDPQLHFGWKSADRQDWHELLDPRKERFLWHSVVSEVLTDRIRESLP